MEECSSVLRRLVPWKGDGKWNNGKCTRVRCGRCVLGDQWRGIVLWILISFDRIKWTFCSIVPNHHRTTCAGPPYANHGRDDDHDSPSSQHQLLMLIASIFLFLYVLGVVKAIMGMRCPCVGMWGLSTLIEIPRVIPHYHEPHLSHHRVVYDEDGYPVHPDTGKRTVRMISRYSEFCLNSVLFLVLPCAILCTSCCRVFCYWKRCAQRVDTCPGCSAHCDRSPPDCADKDRLLPDAVGSRDRCACDDATEERDARYVALQLQKSRDSLANNDIAWLCDRCDANTSRISLIDVIVCAESMPQVEDRRQARKMQLVISGTLSVSAKSQAFSKPRHRRGLLREGEM